MHKSRGLEGDHDSGGLIFFFFPGRGGAQIPFGPENLPEHQKGGGAIGTHPGMHLKWIIRPVF